MSRVWPVGAKEAHITGSCASEEGGSLGPGLGLGLRNCSRWTRARLLCQKERGLKKQRESKRSWASEEGGRGRVRVRVKTIFLSVDPGIELGLTVFVTSRRYRQTNSAQALKETNRFA